MSERPPNRPTEPHVAHAVEMLSHCVAGRTRLISRVVTAIYDEALRPEGIRAGQLTILAIAAFAGRVRPQELQSYLRMEKSTVSRNVARMVAAGWLSKVEDESGPSYAVELSTPGREKLERALPLWRQAQDRARRRLGEAGFDALRELGGDLLEASGAWDR